MTSADRSGLPDMDRAPFSDEQVAAMKHYQESGEFHPYTCCDHQVMQMTSNGMVCPKCGALQDWVLRATLSRMTRREN